MNTPKYHITKLIHGGDLVVGKQLPERVELIFWRIHNENISP
jgi:hypothetical protein